MIIIGIDPGTIITGFGIIYVDGSSYKAIDYGCIKPPAKYKLTDRHLIIFDGVNELIEKHCPQVLSIETQFVKKNSQTANHQTTIKIGMTRGIVIVAAKKNRLSVFEYSPTQAKRAVVGNGRASKYQVQGMVKQLLSLPKPPFPEDAADALALAICHAHSIRLGSKQILEI
jgi:crossover junction endodeoxyribonuclease RuvC